MRPSLPLLLAGLALAPLPAPAQTTASPDALSGQPVQPRLVIGAPGRCEMDVNGSARPCTSGLVYVHHTDGRVLLSVQAGPGVTIGFQADSDRQPRPEEYTMLLARMHTSVNGRSAAKAVSGACEIGMSADGRTWHRATCRATDRSGLVTTMTFTGDGRPVTAARPGQESREGSHGPTKG